MMLTTIPAAKRAMRVTHSDDDAYICLLIKAASEAVVAYLDTRADAILEFDSGGDLAPGAVVPAAVEVATQITVRVMYESKDDATARPGAIPYQAETLLYRLTDPPLR